MNLNRSERQGAATIHDHRRERGQVIVIFAAAMVLFVLLCAAVIDMSWYWTNNLRMQRAADAAALAGVIFLPGSPSRAYSTALAEAEKNGYKNGVNGISVTPIQDTDNLRQLRVTIAGPVNTFFARVIGINAWQASRDAHSEYVLPVPMGSPQQWYGVGTFDAVKATQGADVAGATTNTGYDQSSTTPAGTWTNPGNADGNDNDVFAVSPPATGSTQQWGGFGLTSGAGAIPASAVIEGIQVRYRALITGGASGSQSDCRLLTDLSWNGGTTWTTTPVTHTLTNP